jgi:hypothetical protein
MEGAMASTARPSDETQRHSDTADETQRRDTRAEAGAVHARPSDELAPSPGTAGQQGGGRRPAARCASTCGGRVGGGRGWRAVAALTPAAAPAAAVAAGFVAPIRAAIAVFLAVARSAPLGLKPRRLYAMNHSAGHRAGQRPTALAKFSGRWCWLLAHSAQQRPGALTPRPRAAADRRRLRASGEGDERTRRAGDAAAKGIRRGARPAGEGGGAAARRGGAGAAARVLVLLGAAGAKSCVHACVVRREVSTPWPCWHPSPSTSRSSKADGWHAQMHWRPTQHVCTRGRAVQATLSVQFASR